METLTIKVGGMTCQGCVGSVTRVLQATPGVQRAQVSLERGEAEVTYDPHTTGVAQLKAAVADAGYEPA